MTQKGEEAAFGRRRKVAPQLRRAAYGALSRRSIAAGLLKGNPPDAEAPAPAAAYVRLHPPIRSSAQLSDIAARVNWYLPDIRLPIVVQRAAGTEVHPSHAPWMQPELVRDPGWVESPPPGPSHDLIHHVGPREALRVLRRGRSSIVAAPDFSPVADLGWIWLRWHFAEMPSRSTTPALERLSSLRAAGNSAFVLATGPSARMVDPDAVTADIRISCNSVVRDHDLLRALKPNVICFGDPVFHYGPSRYAATFRRDLLRAVDETDALLVTPELWAGLLLAHAPELAERLIILRFRKGEMPWHWPTQERMTVRLTANILTNSMLPMAFALAESVEIAGCDGRHPDENYFWKHNTRTQYSDELMVTAFDAHPAFFRDQDYSDYYDLHCQQLEELLAAGEKVGKRATGVTPSYIPALTSRGAPTPVP